MTQNAPTDGAASAAPAAQRRDRLRVIFARAAGCAACRQMAPLVEEVARDHPDVHTETLEINSDPDGARQLSIMATPTVIGFAGGTEVVRLVGRQGRHALEQLYAGLASRRTATQRWAADSRLRLLTAVVLVVLGAVTGPSLPLVATGVAVGVYGLVVERRRP